MNFFLHVKQNKVWFNNSWFVFHDSSLSFHESYISRKHISRIMLSDQNTRLQPWNLQITTKLSGNVIALKAPLSTIFGIIHIFIKQKFCKNHFLQNQKQQIKKTRKLTIQIFTFYLIYSGVKKEFRKIMQHKEILFGL